MFRWSFGGNHRPMITALLHMLRLLPFLCGGHRHLALENDEVSRRAPLSFVGSQDGGFTVEVMNRLRFATPPP
jgi:hypothetical protein